ncbi:hypothetical protein [Actimicrobium antarcticum]|uniref:hypothetical protein n=1 Tax=Actimicrobium antarcticum TaxID=1051899 RepID=UPI0031D65A82
MECLAQRVRFGPFEWVKVVDQSICFTASRQNFNRNFRCCGYSLLSKLIYLIGINPLAARKPMHCVAGANISASRPCQRPQSDGGLAPERSELEGICFSE